METIYSDAAYSRSNEELIVRVNTRQKYMPETVEASITVLQYRGHKFSDDEIKMINEDLQAMRANAALVTTKLGFFSKEYKNVITEDPDAPLLYSRLAIYGFSFLLGAWFGSIMMAINLSRLGKFIEPIWAVLFGVIFTIVQFILLAYIDSRSVHLFYLFFGFIAAYCVDSLLWKNYIDYSTFYRKKPIWIPLIIALLLASFMLFFFFVKSLVSVD